MITLLAYDYLAGLRGPKYYIPLPYDDIAGIRYSLGSKSYIRPDNIIKSSVGEFYDQNMKFFLETIDLLIPVVSEQLLKNDEPIRELDKILSHLLPLGYLFPDSELLSLYVPGYFTDPLGLDTVKGNSYNTAYLDEGTVHVLSEIRDLMSFHKNTCHSIDEVRGLKIEKVAHSLCAGYSPQKIDSVCRVPYDSGYLSEYIMANTLYPWVMQPMKQLRLLVPCLDDDFKKHIIESYVPPNDSMLKAHLGWALDAGYSISYDLLGDFLTYAKFRNVRGQYPCQLIHQFWTPFFGFSMPAVLTELKDEKLKERIVECVARSKKLYVEMLKTGLRYQAQYGLLCGYIGRLNLSGNLASILEYVFALKEDNQPGTVSDMVAEIAKDLKNTIPFAKESGLLN